MEALAEALAPALRDSMIQDFKLDVGNAVIKRAKQLLVAVVLALALHGAGLDRAVLAEVVTR